MTVEILVLPFCLTPTGAVNRHKLNSGTAAQGFHLLNSMPYLNVDLDYFDHRKTKRLIGLLGKGSEILPIRLWAYCGKFHSEDGRFTGYSEQEIESISSWWGKSGELLPAMKTSNWMNQDSAGWFMVAWHEHQGHLMAFKLKGKAMAETRWRRVREQAEKLAGSNAGSIPASNALSDLILSKPTDPILPNGVAPAAAPPKKFQKPEFHEMEFQAMKIGLPVTEINGFFNHYEANGWRVGRNPMKDWRAAMSNWKRIYDTNRFNQNAGRNSGGGIKPNPRNHGIVKGPTDYAAAARRKAESGAQAPVAGPMAETKREPPATGSDGGGCL